MKTARAIVIAALLCWVSRPGAAAPPFVYESPGEFLTSGDFNGDGVLDVLVLDKITGNARVGYGDGSGNLNWSAPLMTGAQNPTGCAVGFLLQTSRDAVAVTSAAQNCVNLVDLSNSNNAASPVIVTPPGIGPHTVVALANPLGGGTPPTYNDLLIASSDNNGSAELLDLMGINAGAATETGEYPESFPYDRGNALQVAGTASTFAAGIIRGTNGDTLDIWQFASSPGVMLSFTNLPSGSDYTFGVFNDTALHFIFYLPGDTNLTIATLLQSGGNFSFTNVIETNVPEPIEGIFYLNLTGGGSALIEFTNGVEGMSISNNAITFASLYGAGAETGNVFSGVVPLGVGQFALLDAPPGNLASAHVQVISFNGHTYTQKNTGNLPATTARNTRANIWLFETEPFVNRQAGFVASLSDPDWTDSSTGLPTALSVKTEIDGGPTNGLGSPVTNNLGIPPTGSSNTLVNQYCPAISLFSYGGPQPAQPVTVTISPPPGPYDASVTISFSTLNSSDKVFYRVGGADSYHLYSASFTITNDNTIQYYGTNAAQPRRSQLQFASYTVGNNNQISTSPDSPNVTGNPNGATNTPPPTNVVPNVVISSTVGTLFYGRRSATNTGTIWAINLDGSDDTYITQGVRPRASRDGAWIAFLREGNPFNSQGNLWIHNLQTGAEQRLLVNTNTIVCCDWEPDDSGLILDYGCGIFRLGLDGSLSKIISTDCYGQAPVLSHVDEQIAYHDLSSANNSIPGLWLANPDGTAPRLIVSSVPGASWMEWSPDGKSLSFVDDNSVASLDDGTNLWVVSPNGTHLNRICDFAGTGDHFPHGAIWSPDSTSLVGAGMIDETNGIWIIPLNADRSDCGGTAILLPTTPGDAIDFAGSVVVASQPPVIVTQPQSIILQRGQSGSASVTAVGGPPLHYEWMKDGFLLPNQTSNTISFASFQLTNSGIYQVVVTNSWGIAISYPVRIAISDAPLIGWGDDFYGELGTGDSGGNFNQGPFIVATNVVAASSGYAHTLYLTADGNLWAVGQSAEGQLGAIAIYYNPILIASNVVEIACSIEDSFYLTADGTLWGMGNNLWGQLGVQNNDYNTQIALYPLSDSIEFTGTPIEIFPAIPVASNVVAVSAYGTFSGSDTAFITADGNLWTMGENYFGQLGDGTFNTNFYGCVDVPVNVADNVVSVSAGYTDTLFVKADGTLWGMGANADGELGNGTTNMVTWPEFLATNVIGASAGDDFSLFLTADGTLRGMGNSAFLGIAPAVSNTQGYDPAQVINVLRPLALANHVMAVAVEDSGFFYETTDGTLWGAGSIGAVSEFNVAYFNPPIQYPGSMVASLCHSEYQSIFATVWLSCPTMVYSNATVALRFPFTLSSESNPADNDGYTCATPASWDNFTNTTRVIYYTTTLQWELNGVDIPGATNGIYSVANTTASDAGVYTLATVGPFNNSSSLNTATVSVLTPPSAPVITQQPTGISATVGQTLNVSVVAQGAGVPTANSLSYEWIKDGVLLPSQTNSTLSFAAFQITDTGAYQVVVSNAMGLVISMPALLGVTNAPLRGWGLDDYSQLGDNGFNYDVAAPELVASNVVMAAAGAHHSLYVTGDGTLWGMGYDFDGELGDGNNDVQNTPEAVTNNVVAAAAGEYFSLYITADGTLWSMGDNTWGQLGYDSFPNSAFPQAVATNVVAVAAGGYHSLFLTADGTLWGMGNGQSGQLGNIGGTVDPEVLATNVVAMTGGDLCSFFITADGTLWALGDNSEGELGDGGSELSTNQPEKIATNVVAVSAGGCRSPFLNLGGYHTMFITADSNLWVMGYNGDGELGDGELELSTNVPELLASNVVAVSAGGAQSFYVTAGGGLWAAGDNSYGELGLGFNGDGSTPMQYNNGSLLTAGLARGEAAFHGLAIAGEAPQVFLPNVLATDGQPFTFVPVIESGDGPFTYQWLYLDIAIPGATNATYTVSDALPDYIGDFDYAVLVTGPYGSNYAFGAYYYPAAPVLFTGSYPPGGVATAGQFAYVNVSANSLLPVSYQWLKDGTILPGQDGSIIFYDSFEFTNAGTYQVVASNSAGIAISLPMILTLSNAPLQVWGANTFGQLGDSTSNNARLPETVASNVVMAAAGANHSLYLTADQTLWAMGQNSSGQLGIGTNYSDANPPRSVATNVLAVAAGAAHSLYITADGSLWGMGADESGELGDGANITEFLPEELVTNVVAVAAGQEHSLYLTGDGTLWAMGQNSSGQLGNGTANNALLPGIVTNNVIAVAAGGRHSLYLTMDWNLWAMGLNSSGQLGTGTTNNVDLPVLVTNNVIAIAAGDSHSLYVTADGKLWAMGENSFGQLGNGTTTSTNVPVIVATNVTAVSAGADHSMYITGDGRIWAMGRNASGQLGNGTTHNTNRPVAVGGLVAANLAEGPEASHALAVAVTGPSLISPMITAVTVQTNSGGPGMTITLTVNPSQTYQVQVSADLKTWTLLGSFSPNAFGQLVVTDTGATTSSRFYRLEVQ